MLLLLLVSQFSLFFFSVIAINTDFDVQKDLDVQKNLMKFASVFHFHSPLILNTTRNCRLQNITKARLLLDNIDHIVFRQVSYRASWAIKIIAKSLFLTTLVTIPCNHLYRPNQRSTRSMWDSVHANATYTHII